MSVIGGQKMELFFGNWIDSVLRKATTYEINLNQIISVGRNCTEVTLHSIENEINQLIIEIIKE